ncbi:MAG: recombinase family protein [Nitrososphaera sp.]|nr:recombinase family protein [Nitrososphaera sp.]
MDAPKVFSYLRFSADIQSRGDSIRRQTQLARDYCDKNGLVLDESLSFRDLGRSAFRNQHAATGKLGLFLKSIEKGKVKQGDILLVESIDRLSRSTITDALMLFIGILKSGVEIVTLIDGNVYTKEACNDLGKLLVPLVSMSRAWEESEVKSRRIAAAWSDKRKRAETEGHKLTRTVPAWLRLSEDRTGFDVLEERAELIRTIFDMTITGFGIEAIATSFNKKLLDTWDGGIHRSRKAKGWRRGYIFRLLHNRSVLGEFHPTKRVQGTPTFIDPIIGYYPPIVSEAIFNQAHQAIASRRGKGSGRPADTENIFAGLLKCGYCKGTLIRINKGRNYPPYFTCDNYRRGLTDCGSHKWVHSELDQAIISEIRELTIDKLMPKQRSSVIDALRSQLANIDGAISDTRNRITRLLDAIETDGSVSLLTQQLKQRQTEIELLETDRAIVESEYKKEKTRSETIGRTLEDTQSLIGALCDRNARVKARQLIREMIEGIVVKCDKRHFVIHYAVSGELPQERKTIVRLKSGQSIEFREDVLP